MIGMNNLEEILADIENLRSNLKNRDKLAKLKTSSSIEKAELFQSVVCLFQSKEAEELLTTMTNLGINIKKKINPIESPSTHKTAIHFLIERHTGNVDQKTLLERLRILVNQGCGIQEVDDLGFDALDYAIMGNDNIAINSLLSMKANPNGRSKVINYMMPGMSPSVCSRIELAIKNNCLFWVEKWSNGDFELYSNDTSTANGDVLAAAIQFASQNQTIESFKILELILSSPRISLNEAFPHKIYNLAPGSFLSPMAMYPQNGTFLDIVLLQDSPLPSRVVNMIRKAVSRRILDALVLLQANIQHFSSPDLKMKNNQLLSAISGKTKSLEQESVFENKKSHDFENKRSQEFENKQVQESVPMGMGLPMQQNTGLGLNSGSQAGLQSGSSQIQHPIFDMYFSDYGVTEASQKFIQQEVQRLCKSPAVLRLADIECNNMQRSNTQPQVIFSLGLKNTPVTGENGNMQSLKATSSNKS